MVVFHVSTFILLLRTAGGFPYTTTKGRPYMGAPLQTVEKLRFSTDIRICSSSRKPPCGSHSQIRKEWAMTAHVRHCL